MTLRLVFGIDPGQTGAVVALADGEPVAVIDMPTYPRKAGGHEVDPYTLASELREVIRAHDGAYVVACIEQVSAMPNQGSASGFRFGQSDGMVRGVLGALGIARIEVPAAKWKKYFILTGQEKDAARGLAIRRLPKIADSLKRKKDIGRADAALIALWAHQTEQVGGGN